MDSKTKFQPKNNGFSWVDALFYFTVSLLIAVVFCYAMFFVKNNAQKKEIAEHEVELQDIGTDQQKQYEKTVIYYQKKIKDFLVLFRNHEFASRTFAFMQDETLSDIWFKQFNLDKKNEKIQLLGEAKNMEIFSRQVANFETSEYVEGVDALNSNIAEAGATIFNVNLNMTSALFSYIPEMTAGSDTQTLVTESSQDIFQKSQGSDGKMITVFDILLNPEVIGQVDQENKKILVEVPYGTDVFNLTPLIIISPGASVSPASSVAQNFAQPIVYTVTAENGSMQKYTVTVNILPSPEEKKQKQSFNFIFVITGFLLLVVATITGMFLINKFKNKKKNEA